MKSMTTTSRLSFVHPHSTTWVLSYYESPIINDLPPLCPMPTGLLRRSDNRTLKDVTAPNTTVTFNKSKQILNIYEIFNTSSLVISPRVVAIV